MSLQLNGPNEPVESYKEFYGPNNMQMSLLIADGRTPLSSDGLMSRYLEVLRLHRDAPKELKPAYTSVLKAWEDNHFDTGDGAPRHSDGRMKVVPDAHYLRILTPETRLVGGAVDLSEIYTTLNVEEFSEADVERYCGMPLSRSGAKKNPVWLALARGDKALLGDFVDARFSRAKQLYGYKGKMMGVYAPPVPKEGEAGRLWAVYGLYGGIDGSWAGGSGRLDDNFGRLVVGAPEAQRAAQQTLEQRVLVPQ